MSLFRVPRPGGALIASDAYDNEGTRQHHIDDVFVPLGPQTCPTVSAPPGSPPHARRISPG